MLFVWYCCVCYVCLGLALLICVVFFFFKQKTAYEMRISDWSSDVCSSDLRPIAPKPAITHYAPLRQGRAPGGPVTEVACRLETGRTHQIREIGRASCRERVCQYV